jgi:hypothetical protein
MTTTTKVTTGNCTAGRNPVLPPNQTSLRLFFQLLHKARMMKQSRRNPIIRRAVLVGMRWVFIENAEDFRIADSQRDYWKRINTGERI